MFRWSTGEREQRSGQRGQALAMFAGGLVAVLVATGFVLDGGIAFVARRDAQNASDLAAMAGTQLVAEFHKGEALTGADVYAAVDKTVKDNGCLPAEPCTWTADYVRPTTGYNTTKVAAVTGAGAIPATAQGVEVRVDRNPGTGFLRVIGQNDWDVSAAATAITARVENPGAGILLPIAFDPGRLDQGETAIDYDTPYLFSTGMDGPGNFSWLAWNDNNDANYLGDIVCEAQNPPYTLPTYIPGMPGAKNAKAVRACLDDYVGSIVYVPLWGDECADGPVTGRGSFLDYCVYGVAAFRFLGYEAGTGNVAIKNARGVFQEFVTFSDVPGSFGPPPCDPMLDPTCKSVTTYLGLIR
jgi:hypothetical protein